MHLSSCSVVAMDWMSEDYIRNSIAILLLSGSIEMLGYGTYLVVPVDTGRPLLFSDTPNARLGRETRNVVQATDTLPLPV